MNHGRPKSCYLCGSCVCIMRTVLYEIYSVSQNVLVEENFGQFQPHTDSFDISIIARFDVDTCAWKKGDCDIRAKRSLVVQIVARKNYAISQSKLEGAVFIFEGELSHFLVRIEKLNGRISRSINGRIDISETKVFSMIIVIP